MSGEKPLSILYNVRNTMVLVRLRGNKQVRGILRGFDTHMNLILENAEEILEDSTKPRGTLIIRGDNVVLIAPASR
ncbi:MAG: small nuclear ribonucleoprotein [Candidatus Odinarchaeota archaeon]|nr:small nuclear ribonucleoprotein [Candidatus Odinarchaeota archaeon]